MTKITRNNEPLALERDIAFDELVANTKITEELRQEVTAFVSREARLLDSRMYRTWHSEILSPEITYDIVSKELRSIKERRYDQPDTVYLYNDDHYQLGIRVEHDLDPQNWRSSPLEKYSRIVTNIELAQKQGTTDIQVRCSCIVTRARRAYQVDQFCYTRDDVITRDEEGKLRLKSRYIEYPERCISGHNMLMYL